MEFPISRTCARCIWPTVSNPHDLLDDISTFTARQEVLDRLAQATMPTGVNPGLGPDYSPTGGFCVSLERKRRVATRLLEVGSFVMPRRRAAVCVRAASGACIDRSNRRLIQFFPFYRIDKFRRTAETCGVHWACGNRTDH